MPDYKLSAQLKGHDGDVRAVCFPTANVVLSASRDHTVRIWRRTAENPKFDATITTQGHEYVNSLTFLRPHGQYSDGLIVSSGKEPIIEVKKPTSTPSDNAERLLVGHGNNVCALDTSPRGSWIVSGSWDGKAIIWGTDTWEVAHHLVHEGDVKSVWAVLAYDESTVITGSADGLVRIFKLAGNKSTEITPWKTLSTGGVVRALCKLPTGLQGHPSGAEFASAGNDGIIRLWKMNGTEVGSLSGHDSFIYSLAALPGGEIVSSGEDRTVRIWRGSKCVQTITHPAISVWTVAVCAENGDIVSGASDNVVRVFTRNEDRVADAETIAQFEESVRASAIPQQQLGETINRENQDPKSWLQTHSGTKDGQVKTVREDDGSVGAYQWSTSQGKWIHVGIVVDSAASSGKKVTYKGKEYDYVFDVDIEDGKPPLQLPYNLSDNPYEAATKFLGDNELPITYLDSVANFITQNTQAATLGQTNNAPSADPYGTESRYRPDSAPEPPKKKFLPHMQYLSLTQAKLEAALKKLKELNEKQSERNAVDAASISLLESQVGTISKAPSATGDEGSPATLEAAQVIFAIITQWPYADRLPALDFLRCLVPHPKVAAQTDRHFGDIINIAIRGALDPDFRGDNSTLGDFIEKGVDEKALNANSVMMALRTITNLFSTPEGGKLVASQIATVVNFLSRVAGTNEGQQPIGAANVNVQIALTSVTFNLACLAFRERKKSPPEESVDLGALAEIINIVETTVRKQTDNEVLFRALMTLGMLLAAGGDPRELAKSLEAQEWVALAAKKTGDTRVKDVAAECLSYLKQ